MVNQIQAPTMKNATSLSSVYRGDNITGKEVKTAIIFSPCTIHVCKLKYYKPHNLTSEGCTVPLVEYIILIIILSSQTIKYFKGKGNDCVSNAHSHSVRCIQSCTFSNLVALKNFNLMILSNQIYM